LGVAFALALAAAAFAFDAFAFAFDAAAFAFDAMLVAMLALAGLFAFMLPFAFSFPVPLHPAAKAPSDKDATSAAIRNLVMKPPVRSAKIEFEFSSNLVKGSEVLPPVLAPVGLKD